MKVKFIVYLYLYNALGNVFSIFYKIARMPNLELFFLNDMKKKTAILVDGGFFLKRYRSINRIKTMDPIRTANDLWEMCLSHLTQAKGELYDLYRILYYDCLPYDKKQHNPVTGKAIYLNILMDWSRK